MYVDEKTAKIKKTVRGTTYCFCSDACLRQFEKPEVELRKLKILVVENPGARIERKRGIEAAHLLLGGCPLQRARRRIVGVHCSTCILPGRRALEKAEGVKSVGANYMTDLILVDYDEKVTNEAEIVALIKKVGYEAITLAAPYF